MNSQRFQTVEHCIAEISAGKMIILVDDEDRENEGDLVVAAEHCTPEHINFMCKYGRGLVCLALTSRRVEELKLPMMVPTAAADMGTAFTVSIEAKQGVTTGISARDRAETIRVAVDENRGASDITSPGHIFPLRAKSGGVLVRSGHTEGAVDLAQLAGLNPSGVICEIMRDDGEMARVNDLELFAKQHDLPILTIESLIEYRLERETMVEQVDSAVFRSRQLGIDETMEWRVTTFRARVNPELYFVALCKGDVAQESNNEPVLLRAQRAQVLGDVFGLTSEDSHSQIRHAIARIEQAGRGVFLYVLGHDFHDFDHWLHGEQKSSPQPNEQGFREFGLGAQVLKKLGINRIQILTNHPRKIVGVEGFGIQVTGTVALSSESTE